MRIQSRVHWIHCFGHEARQRDWRGSSAQPRLDREVRQGECCSGLGSREQDRKGLGSRLRGRGACRVSVRTRVGSLEPRAGEPACDPSAQEVTTAPGASWLAVSMSSSFKERLYLSI